MQFGVSYFGVRNPQHFQHDLEDIARLAFTSIIFTCSAVAFFTKFSSLKRPSASRPMS